MLGTLLRVSEQLLRERSVSFSIGSSWTGPGNRSDRCGSSFQTHKHLRRRSNNKERLIVHEPEIKKKHVGGWVEASHRAINIKRLGVGFAREALREHPLKNIARRNVLLRIAHHVLITSRSE